MTVRIGTEQRNIALWKNALIRSNQVVPTSAIGTYWGVCSTTAPNIITNRRIEIRTSSFFVLMTLGLPRSREYIDVILCGSEVVGVPLRWWL